MNERRIDGSSIDVMGVDKWQSNVCDVALLLMTPIWATNN